METAVQELSSRQLAKIKELTKQAERKAQVLEQVYKANIGKLKRFQVEEDVHVAASKDPSIYKSPKRDLKKRVLSPGLKSPQGLLSTKSARPAKSVKGERISTKKNNDKSDLKSHRELQGNSYEFTLAPGHRKYMSVSKMQTSPLKKGNHF